MAVNFPMKIDEISSVSFFGIGKSNLSLIRALDLYGIDVTLRSDAPIRLDTLPETLKPSRILTGKDAYKDITEDVIFFSPSVRRERAEFFEAKSRGVKFSSDAEIFFELNTSPLLTVTGSDGKSTTATLTKEILSRESQNTALVGNIGQPMLETLASDTSFTVAELSSFTLRYFVPKSRLACITNITPNHLNWHESFAEYRDTKLSLLSNSDNSVVSVDDEILSDYARTHRLFGVVSLKKGFDELTRCYRAEIYMTAESGYVVRNGKRLLKIDEIQRNEPHNLKNLMCAICMCYGLACDDAIRSVAGEFSGLEHRYERFFSINGIDFINSSIDSTPTRTLETVRSIHAPIVIILGGRKKGVGFDLLKKELPGRVRYAVLTGECAGEIYDELHGVIPCNIIKPFSDATEFAISEVKDGETLLLSPAATSYDEFSSFEERGKLFKSIIKNHYIRT